MAVGFDRQVETPTSEPCVVTLEPMQRDDLVNVMAIEQQVYPHPWTTGLFLSELALPQNRSYSVAKVADELVGYVGVMFVGDDAHITTIAVEPRWQRHKVATRLMLHAARVSLANACRHMTLEVRVSNETAQGLYRKFGLAPAGIRKNYYTELKEDALVMWVNDIDSPGYGQRLLDIESTIGKSS